MTTEQLLALLPRLGPRWPEEAAIAIDVGAPAVRKWIVASRVPPLRAAAFARFLRDKKLTRLPEVQIVAILLNLSAGRSRKRA